MAHPTDLRPDASSPRPTGGERAGRRVAIVVFYAIVAAFCVASTVQITRQVFFLDETATSYATCEEGLRALAAGVARARDAASQKEGGEEGEQGALGTFRGALRPEWDHRDEIARRCQTDAQKGALDAIERLRYAEEHAVRREAGDLAPLRRKVQALLETELAASP